MLCSERGGRGREREREEDGSTPAAIKGMMAEESKGASGESKMKMKVVVAVDGSEASMNALGWALDHLFKPTAGLRGTGERLDTLIVLHAQPPVHVLVQPVGPAIYATSYSVKKAQDQNSAFVVANAVQLCKERLVEAKTMVMEGDPKDVICQAAEQVNADLLVMGSRGLSMLRRALLGSVSDYVARHANCPVLIVKPPKMHPKHETAGESSA